MFGGASFAVPFVRLRATFTAVAALFAFALVSPALLFNVLFFSLVCLLFCLDVVRLFGDFRFTVPRRLLLGCANLFADRARDVHASSRLRVDRLASFVRLHGN